MRNKWLNRGGFDTKEEAKPYLDSLREDFKKHDIPKKHLRIKKIKGRYIVQSLFER